MHKNLFVKIVLLLFLMLSGFSLFSMEQSIAEKTPAELYKQGAKYQKAGLINLALESFLASAREGHVDGCYAYGILLYKRERSFSLTSQTINTAITWLEIAAYKGHAMAKFCLGYHYQTLADEFKEEEEEKVLLQKAKEWYLKGFQQKNNNCAFHLAYLYTDRARNSTDTMQKIKFYQKALQYYQKVIQQKSKLRELGLGACSESCIDLAALHLVECLQNHNAADASQHFGKLNTYLYKRTLAVSALESVKKHKPSDPEEAG